MCSNGTNLLKTLQAGHPLWTTEGAWFRERGRTRLIVIDDDFHSSADFWGDHCVEVEKRLREWLNVEMVFFSRPTGGYDEDWCVSNIKLIKESELPVAAIILDLKFGDDHRFGIRVLRMLRLEMPGIPIVILTYNEPSLDLRKDLKTGDGKEELSAFECFFNKMEFHLRGQEAVIAETLLRWGDLSDPRISAYSFSMRRLARDMRRVVLDRQRVRYQSVEAGDYPRPVVLVGDYGSGKNYLAEHLVRMSDRSTKLCETFNFANTTLEEFEIGMFGTGPFTGAPEDFIVDECHGSILGRRAAAKAAKESAEGISLAIIGLLHQVGLAGSAANWKRGDRDDSLGGIDRLVPGSLILDELGTATKEMQAKLLGIFNHGKFRPRLCPYSLPGEGSLDVWFLVTVSPELLANLRPDLHSRLNAGHRLEIPDLHQRAEDVLPLTVRLFNHASGRQGSDIPHPDALLTKNAQDYLTEAAKAREFQVRDLANTLLACPRVSEVLPYNIAEVQEARKQSEKAMKPKCK